MKDLIHHKRGFVDSEIASLVARYAKDHDHIFTDFGNNEKEFTVHTHGDIRGYSSEIVDIINEYARRVYSFVVDSYPGPFKEFDENTTHIARFSSGKGMHEHFDSSRPNDIATLVYLNNDYEGGEIYFPEYDIFIKPEPGDLLTFPDNPNFVHGVKPVVSGVRYTTPRWFTRIV